MNFEVTKLIAGIPTVATLLVTGGLISLLLTRYFDRSNEKRKMYAQAYKVVLSWQEMLYRVRRRSKGDEAKRVLIDKFHDLQEELNYFQGILSSESRSLGYSYQKFVSTVKKDNESLINQAWQATPQEPGDGAASKDTHPNPNKRAEEFLRDVRWWSAWWQIPKISVWWRNRK